jgi:hypothetical protein
VLLGLQVDLGPVAAAGNTWHFPCQPERAKNIELLLDIRVKHRWETGEDANFGDLHNQTKNGMVLGT